MAGVLSPVSFRIAPKAHKTPSQAPASPEAGAVLILDKLATRKYKRHCLRMLARSGTPRIMPAGKLSLLFTLSRTARKRKPTHPLRQEPFLSGPVQSVGN
jgi:hypothetical protein